MAVMNNTTNNRMELTGVIQAILLANEKGYSEIEIYSDSAYVVNAIEKMWLDRWVKNDWITSQNMVVKNKDLWKKYLKAAEKIHKINFTKVKGHAGEKYNEIVDKLAVRGSKNILDETIKNGGVYSVNCSEIKDT